MNLLDLLTSARQWICLTFIYISLQWLIPNKTLHSTCHKATNSSDKMFLIDDVSAVNRWISTVDSAHTILQDTLSS
jgi:hypothetical protein